MLDRFSRPRYGDASGSVGLAFTGVSGPTRSGKCLELVDRLRPLAGPGSNVRGEGDMLFIVLLRRMLLGELGDPGELVLGIRVRRLSTRPGRSTGNCDGVPGESCSRPARNVRMLEEDEMVVRGESSYPSVTGDMKADLDAGGTGCVGEGVPRWAALVDRRRGCRSISAILVSNADRSASAASSRCRSLSRELSRMAISSL